MQERQSPKFLGLVALLIVFAGSLVIRADNIWHRPLLSHNEDATGHVLATLKGMNAAPVAVHKYLPIITLSQNQADRGIDNFYLASISDARGNYFYVSFPPAGFAVPALVFQAIGIEPSLLHLRLLAAALGLATTIAIYFLALALFPPALMRGGNQAVVACSIASLVLLNSDSLWIFGNVYWHHVLFTPVLALALLTIAGTLMRPTPAKVVALVLLSFLACSIEWAGFPMAAGMAVVGLYLIIKGRPGGTALMLAGVLGAVLGAAFIGWHFSQVAGLDAYLTVLRNRPNEHGWTENAAIQAIIVLLPIYLPLSAMAAVFLWKRTERSDMAAPARTHWRQVIAPVMTCSAFAALESIILLKHTAKYTYGALPLTIFLTLCLLCLFIRFSPRIRTLVVGTAVCATVWLGVYFLQNPPSLAQSEFGRQFANLAEIPKRAAADEVVFANLNFPAGVPLATTSRNIARPIDLPADMPLNGMQAILARTHNERGKLFLFDIPPGRIPQLIWWPYTKSRVVTYPEYEYGPLAALITFDRNRIISIAVRPDQHSRKILQHWLDASSARPRPDATR